MEGGQVSTSKILMLIGAFLAITVGSFIYFVATWDRELEEPVSQMTPFSSDKYSGVWGSAPALSTGDVA